MFSLLHFHQVAAPSGLYLGLYTLNSFGVHSPQVLIQSSYVLSFTFPPSCSPFGALLGAIYIKLLRSSFATGSHTIKLCSLFYISTKLQPLRGFTWGYIH